MAQYYFTVASLPTLSLEDQPFYTPDELLEICERELSVSERQLLNLGRNYYTQSDAQATYRGVLGRYHAWESRIKQALQAVRAQKLGWETQTEEHVSDPEAERIARELIGQESPYEAEIKLQQARWNKLEELSTGHHFDVDSIVIYMLKALVIERYKMMDKENGAERFNEIYSNMVQALSRRPE